MQILCIIQGGALTHVIKIIDHVNILVTNHGSDSAILFLTSIYSITTHFFREIPLC